MAVSRPRELTRFDSTYCYARIDLVPPEATNEPGSDEFAKRQVSVPVQDVLELVKTRLTEDVLKTVEAELKRRYFCIALITATVTRGLITLIVRNMMIDSLVRINAAETVQSRASARLTEAAEKSEESLKRLINQLKEEIIWTEVHEPARR